MYNRCSCCDSVRTTDLGIIFIMGVIPVIVMLATAYKTDTHVIDLIAGALRIAIGEA